MNTKESADDSSNKTLVLNYRQKKDQQSYSSVDPVRFIFYYQQINFLKKEFIINPRILKKIYN